MKQLISEHHVEICFQLKDFLRTDHKFEDLVAINTKFFVTNVIDKYFFSIISKFIRTRDKFIKKNKWSESWINNRFDFRKIIVSLKEIFNLSSSFAFCHSRESSKNTTILFEFVISRFSLSKKLSSTLRNGSRSKPNQSSWFGCDSGLGLIFWRSWNHTRIEPIHSGRTGSNPKEKSK
jgi:hypothetical protein